MLRKYRQLCVPSLSCPAPPPTQFPQLLTVYVCGINIIIVWYICCNGTSACVCAKSLQSCPTLCEPVDCSPLGSSVHGIL